MELRADVACKAVDKLIKGKDEREVLKYLYFKGAKNHQSVSSYFCYMMFRLACLHLDENTEAKVFGQIIRMSEVYERRLTFG